MRPRAVRAELLRPSSWPRPFDVQSAARRQTASTRLVGRPLLSLDAGASERGDSRGRLLGALFPRRQPHHDEDHGTKDVDAEVSRMGDPVPPMFWFRDPTGHSLMVVEQS